MHYGVLGMKWGIRRTPEQLGYRVIKAGTTMYRQTATGDESNTGHKYVSYAAPDRDMYKGPLKAFISDTDVYETTYKTVEDILAPSYETSKRIMAKVVSENPKLARKAYADEMVWLRLEDYIYYNAIENPKYVHGSVEQRQKIESKYAEQGRKKITEQAYKEYDEAGGAEFEDYCAAIGGNAEWRNKVLKATSNAGYNAVSDYVGQGFYGRTGFDPLIVINAQKTLKEISTIKVSELESQKATRRATKWLNRYGGTGISKYKADTRDKF